MAKRLSLVSKGFTRRQDLDFSDDGSYFTGYDYKGLPITYCKYNGIYYLSIRVDYLKNSFTYQDWRKTEEYKLEDEFNGVSEVNVDKLVENCEAILVKMAELNKEVKKEKIDVTPMVAHLEEEAALGTKVLDEFRSNFKWWAVNEWKLTSVRRDMDSLVHDIERCERVSQQLLNNELPLSQVRYYTQYFAQYGYIVLREESYSCRSLREALEEN